MNIQNFLATATKLLEQAGIATARLDCLVLLEDTLKNDRSYMLAHPEVLLQTSTLTTLNKQIERRSSHEPLAYIRGKSEFYGREFIVSPATLEPRSETETMIELLKGVVEKGHTSNIVDVGTGSGCLAITAKLEFPESQVMATDISSACLKMAKKNARNLRADITYLQGDLLEISEIQNLKSKICILANLPYVPDSLTINQAAMFEPKLAIFGGPDGLDLYRRLFDQIARLQNRPLYILTEALSFQHEELARIAQVANYRQEVRDDFIQVFSCN